jgi:hypothetical protein
MSRRYGLSLTAHASTFKGGQLEEKAVRDVESLALVES